jgi:hypothetical protein
MSYEGHNTLKQDVRFVHQGRDIGRLVDMAATLEQTALREWLISFSSPGDALATEGLPGSMQSEVELHFSGPAAAAEAL